MNNSVQKPLSRIWDCGATLFYPLAFSLVIVSLGLISACNLVPAAEPPGPIAVKNVRIVKKIPHSQLAFTQGLEFYGEYLYEGTGRYGQSAMRRIDPETGTLLSEKKLANIYFGEGITFFEGQLYQLTWKAGVCFVYDPETLEIISSFDYRGEGWGLNKLNGLLLMSNGSDLLYWRNPVTFAIERTVAVREGNKPLKALNELEVANGRIYSNVLGRDQIAEIDSQSGQVISWVDASSLRLDMAQLLGKNSDTKAFGVLNGIAYNENSGHFFVTGKNWPFMYEVEFLSK